MVRALARIDGVLIYTTNVDRNNRPCYVNELADAPFVVISSLKVEFLRHHITSLTIEMVCLTKTFVY